MEIPCVKSQNKLGRFRNSQVLQDFAEQQDSFSCFASARDSLLWQKEEVNKRTTWEVKEGFVSRGLQCWINAVFTSKQGNC